MNSLSLNSSPPPPELDYPGRKSPLRRDEPRDPRDDFDYTLAANAIEPPNSARQRAEPAPGEPTPSGKTEAGVTPQAASEAAAADPKPAEQSAVAEPANSGEQSSAPIPVNASGVAANDVQTLTLTKRELQQQALAGTQSQSVAVSAEPAEQIADNHSHESPSPELVEDTTVSDEPATATLTNGRVPSIGAKTDRTLTLPEPSFEATLLRSEANPQQPSAPPTDNSVHATAADAAAVRAAVAPSSPTPTNSVTVAVPVPLTGQVVHVVAQHLPSNAKGDHSTVTMRLDPPELGEMRILMRRGDGGIDVRVHAKSGVTLEMLLSRGEEIERVLQSLNVDIHSIEFEHMSGGGDDNPFASSDNRSAMRDDQQHSSNTSEEKFQAQRKRHSRRRPARVSSLLSFRA